MSPETFDAWVPRIMKLLAGLGGLAIMGYETVIDHSDRPWIYAAAITMMGIQVAQGAERLLSKISSGPGTTPPPNIPPLDAAPPPAPEPAAKPKPKPRKRKPPEKERAHKRWLLLGGFTTAATALGQLLMTGHL